MVFSHIKHIDTFKMLDICLCDFFTLFTLARSLCAGPGKGAKSVEWDIRQRCSLHFIKFNIFYRPFSICFTCFTWLIHLLSSIGTGVLFVYYLVFWVAITVSTCLFDINAAETLKKYLGTCNFGFVSLFQDKGKDGSNAPHLYFDWWLLRWDLTHLQTKGCSKL